MCEGVLHVNWQFFFSLTRFKEETCCHLKLSALLRLPSPFYFVAQNIEDYFELFLFPESFTAWQEFRTTNFVCIR